MSESFSIKTAKNWFGNEIIPKEVFEINLESQEDKLKFKANRRAYVKFSYEGMGICNNTGSKITIESDSVRTNSYENILSSGPRLVPPPSLTSVEWSFDGTNDIYDAYLWKGTVNFVCYDYDSFLNLEKAFFRHLNSVKLTLGWENYTDSIDIFGKIVDYSFSINEKFHYDCSVTFAGNHIMSAAAFNVFNLDIKQIFKDVFSGIESPEDNKATGNQDFGILNLQLYESVWTAWLPDFIWSNDKLIRYVSLTKLFSELTAYIIKNNNENFEGFLYELTDTTIKKLQISLLKSANVTVCLNGFNTKYADDTDFAWKDMRKDLYISVHEIDRIDSEIRKDKYDNPHVIKQSLIQFIQKVCGSINESLGNAIDLQVIPYNQEGNNNKFGYVITDRNTCIKKIEEQTTVLDLRAPANKNLKIRNISIKSNTSPEYAMTAVSNARFLGTGGMSNIIRGGVFGCPIEGADAGFNREEENKKALEEAARLAPGGRTVTTLTGPAGITMEVETAIVDNTGQVYSSQAAQKFVFENQGEEDQLARLHAQHSQFDIDNVPKQINLLKRIFSVKCGQISGYRYGVTVNFVVDGYHKPLFGKRFRLDGVPGHLTGPNVYFVVIKQGHTFQNGDWTMELEGQMMFDFDGNNPKVTKTYKSSDRKKSTATKKSPPAKANKTNTNSKVNNSNIVIGDSQSPQIANSTQGNFKAYDGLWKEGENVTWLINALKSYPVSGDVKNVVVSIGTNGGFSPGDKIDTLIGLLKEKFPTAKLFAVKGSWGWGGNIETNGINETKANNYYKKFNTAVITVVPTAIGYTTTHPTDSLPSYAQIAKFLNDNAAK